VSEPIAIDHREHAREKANHLSKPQYIESRQCGKGGHDNPQKVGVPLDGSFADIPREPVSSGKILGKPKTDECVFGDTTEIERMDQENGDESGNGQAPEGPAVHLLATEDHHGDERVATPFTARAGPGRHRDSPE